MIILGFLLIMCFCSCGGGMVLTCMYMCGCLNFIKNREVVSAGEDDFGGYNKHRGGNSSKKKNQRGGARGGSLEMTSMNDDDDDDDGGEGGGILPKMSEHVNRLSNTPTVARMNKALSKISNKLGIDPNQSMEYGAYSQVGSSEFGGEDDDDDDVGYNNNSYSDDLHNDEGGMVVLNDADEDEFNDFTSLPAADDHVGHL
jgi:hypothetical protein